MRLRALLVTATAVAGLLAATPAAQAAPVAPAGHHHGPSARDVAAGKAAVARRERQVRHAAHQLAAQRARLQSLRDSAEIAIEAFNRTRVQQQAAEAAVGAARLVLDTATQRVTDARDQVGRFAAAAYMSGGTSSIDAMLTADGPAAMLYRIGTLEVISHSQRDATQALDAARVYRLSVAEQARLVLIEARRAAQASAHARDQAQQAVDRERSVLSSVRQREHRLTTLLTRARQHASALERARLAAIARARARAAAAAARAARAAAAAQRAAAPPPASSGATGDVAGTVSADTQRRAVSYAESQLGKPYRWGAAGPDSYDCSGLTMWAYAQVGVTIDHWTGFQWQEGARIAVSAVRPGDLVFFASDTSDPNTIHHVGMVIGNGQMVEAPHTGANVRISSMWRPDLIGAVRPYNR